MAMPHSDVENPRQAAHSSHRRRVTAAKRRDATVSGPERLEQRFALTVGLQLNNVAQAAAGYTLFGTSFGT